MSNSAYMKRQRHSEQLVSAGGIVYRVNHGEIELVVCSRVSPPLWGLPKGTPEPGETRRQTAIREVGEETGLEVKVESLAGSIDYWFVRSYDGVRCHKRVFFYLMRATGGDKSLHDHEFDAVDWLPAGEALSTLTYQNEVSIVRKGLSMVSEKNIVG